MFCLIFLQSLQTIVFTNLQIGNEISFTKNLTNDDGKKDLCKLGVKSSPSFTALIVTLLKQRIFFNLLQPGFLDFM